jgi:hypothetical protein
VTDQNYTAIAIVMDRSGSMQRIQSDAEGAIKQFVADQRLVEGKATLTLCKFDTEIELPYILTPLTEVGDIELLPRGATALNDAVGSTITRMGEELAKLPEAERPGKVLFVIVTDGYENSSKEWTRSKVFETIKRQTDQWKWDFVFLAANQDAWATAQSYGINRQDHVHTFVATEAGTQSLGRRLSANTTAYRGAGGQSLAMDWEDKDQGVWNPDTGTFDPKPEEEAKS